VVSNLAKRCTKNGFGLLQVKILFDYLILREKPIHICIGDSDLAVNSSIKQNIEIVDESMKESRAVKLLENITDGSKILIFCQTKRACDRLADVLKRERYQAMSIHGDKSQSVNKNHSLYRL
jgi:superfamily II DNA/RNA helicase